MYPHSIWYEPKPERGALDAQSYGRLLFAYLTRGVVNNAPVFGMLTLDDLELVMHSSSNLIAADAASIAIERFAFVRRRVALAIDYLRAEEQSAHYLPTPEPLDIRGTALLSATPKPAPKPIAPAALTRTESAAIF